jgi:hypothetical protein
MVVLILCGCNYLYNAIEETVQVKSFKEQDAKRIF